MAKSHYLDLTDERKIELAQEAVAVGSPIPPVLYTWLQENSLLYRVQNPRGKSYAGYSE